MRNVTPRRIGIALLIVSAAGILEMVLNHSLARPAEGLWWLSAVMVVVAGAIFGGSTGWWARQATEQRASHRLNGLRFGSMFVALMMPTIVGSILGEHATRWFWGLSVLSLTVGYYMGLALGRRGLTEVTVTRTSGTPRVS